MHIFIVNMFEWEPNYAPQPEVIKTIQNFGQTRFKVCSSNKGLP